MPRQEETPLLLLFLEDSSISSQRKQLFGNALNNSRYNRITEGASTVLTQWPGQLSTCCLTAFMFLVFFLTFMIIMLAASFHPESQYPYCLGHKYLDNTTRIYLVHHGKWHQNQFEAIEDIVMNYPDIPIELIDLWNATQTPRRSTPRNTLNRKKKIIKRKQLQARNKEVYIKIDMDWPFTKTSPIALPFTSGKPDLNQPKIKNLKHLLKKHPVIIHDEQTMTNFFALTPLYSVWKTFDMEVVDFAARVLKLWENGGISFKLPEDQPGTTLGSRQIQYKQWRMDTLLGSNLTTFLNLTEGMVNIDNEIFRMETKTPCHAFFGEMITNLRKSSAATYVDDILSATLKTFCENGDVSDSFCSHYFLLE